MSRLTPEKLGNAVALLSHCNITDNTITLSQACDHCLVDFLLPYLLLGGKVRDSPRRDPTSCIIAILFSNITASEMELSPISI